MIELLGTISSVIAVAGVVLNNYRLRACFWLWLVSNAMSAAIHLHAAMWSMAARDVIFLALAIHGLWHWTRK